MTEQQPTWVSLAEAAHLLMVGTPTIEELIERGRLEAREGPAGTEVARESLLAHLRGEQQRLLDSE